jgi:glycosyltransferase involved in cell wall biosynthesis
MPLAQFRNWNPVAQAWLDNHAREFDLLIFDHLIPAVYLKAGMPRSILVEQNAEFSLWMRAAETHQQWYLRPLLRLEALRLRNFEQKICTAVKTVVTLTPEDKALLAPLAPNTPFEVIPPCLPRDPLVGLANPQPPPGKKILFVGTLSWEPNSDGLLWFVEEIWPQVLTRHPDAVLEVIGRGLSITAQETLAQAPGIQLLGFQKNLASFYSDARIVIAPLRFGSGFKLKVLEGMAYGVPVVTTSVGAEGFASNGEVPVTLCRTNQQWHDSIDLLLGDDIVWADCSQIQRSAFITHFSAESRTLQFKNLIDKFLHTN